MKDIKVLLVDDEIEFVTTLAERLEMRDITTIVANDGASALRLIDKERPPVVVLDVMMPGISGLDVLKRIREDYPETKVILLTGRGSTKDGIEGMKLGAFDYLMKPVMIEGLIDKMNKACEAYRSE